MSSIQSPLRRTLLLSSLALCARHVVATEPSWPSRPITLVHPYAAGGPADTMARALARQLELRLKQPVVVDARAGGAATIGTGFVARARPDGYTILMSTSAGHVVTPLMQKIPYDGIADFAFIDIVANQPNVLVMHPSVGVETLQELLDLARKQPGKLNYASAGTGGATHLGAEAILKEARVQIMHVPYAGAAPALKDVLGGQVQLAMLNLAATLPFIEQGKLKALVYGGPKRTPMLPKVPTLAEAGFSGTEVSTWYTLAVPRNTPGEVIDLLHSALKDAKNDPGFQQVLSSQGAERVNLTPKETTAFVQRDKVAMGKLLGNLGLLEK